MITYFTIITAVEKAIDNVTIKGHSIYSEADTLTLIKSHCKYPVIVEFHKKRHQDDFVGLKATLDRLDTLVFHRKNVIHRDVYDGWEHLAFIPTEMSRDVVYYYIDLSGGDFKELKCDRTAMLQENRRVYEVMSFLFKHGCEFEYDGSRAKLRIPRNSYSNRNLSVGRNQLTVHTHHVESHEEIEEITF